MAVDVRVARREAVQEHRRSQNTRMRNAGNLDLAVVLGVLAHADRDVDQAHDGLRRVPVQHRVVGGQNLRERALVSDHVRDELERLACQGVVGEESLFVVTGVPLLVPAQVRVHVFVEQIDRVLATEVLVGEEMVVVELHHPVVERGVTHHFGERSFEATLSVLGGHLHLPLGRKLAGELQARFAERLRPTQQLELTGVGVHEPLGLGTRPHVAG